MEVVQSLKSWITNPDKWVYYWSQALNTFSSQFQLVFIVGDIDGEFPSLTNLCIDLT